MNDPQFYIEELKRRYNPDCDLIVSAPDVTWADMQLVKAIEAQAEEIVALKAALATTIAALAYGETTYPNEDRPHQHALCGQHTEQYLVRAALACDVDLDELAMG